MTGINLALKHDGPVERDSLAELKAQNAELVTALDTALPMLKGYANRCASPDMHSRMHEIDKVVSSINVLLAKAPSLNGLNKEPMS